MLKTYETKPQVIVNVEGLPAVCHNVTCDFTYLADVGEITSFTAVGQKITVTGTNLPTDPAEIQSMSYALSGCTLDPETMTGTKLECELVKEATCGDWTPTVTT